MSIIATYLHSLVSIVEVKSTDTSAAAGDAVSSLSMVLYCLFPPDKIIPLKVFYLLYFIKRWEYSTSSYSSLLRVRGSSGSILLRRCRYFSSFETTSTPLFPNIFMTDIMDN